MNYKLIIMMLVSSMLGLVTLQAQDGSLAEHYMKFLAQEGFRGEIDSDGDVQFKYQGKTYWISVQEDDEEFFRIILPKVWQLDEPGEAERAYEAAILATSSIKVSKVLLVNDYIWISCEIYIADKKDDMKEVFYRMLSSMQACLSKYVQAMQANAPEGRG